MRKAKILTAVLVLVVALCALFIVVAAFSGCKKVKRGEVERSGPSQALVHKSATPEPSAVPSSPSASGYFTFEISGHDGDTIWYVHWTASERVDAVSVTCAGESQDPNNPSFDRFEKRTPGGISGQIKLFLVPNTAYTCSIVDFYPMGSHRGYGNFASNTITLISGPNTP